MNTDLGLIICTILVYIVIFRWLNKYNHNWFLKLSNIIVCIFAILLLLGGALFGGSESVSLDLNKYPVIMIIASIFMLGCLISIFTGIVNAVEQGSIVASIIVILVGIGICCTGVGIPAGIALIFKAGAMGLMKGIENIRKK